MAKALGLHAWHPKWTYFTIQHLQLGTFKWLISTLIGSQVKIKYNMQMECVFLGMLSKTSNYQAKWRTTMYWGRLQWVWWIKRRSVLWIWVFRWLQSWWFWIQTTWYMHWRFYLYNKKSVWFERYVLFTSNKHNWPVGLDVCAVLQGDSYVMDLL